MNDFNELEVNAGSRPIAVLCLGRVTAFYSRPMLEEQSWARRCDLRSVVTDYL
jgi:5,6-dimethylbenzimidazole synthase